jgi:hypothetical protein
MLVRAIIAAIGVFGTGCVTDVAGSDPIGSDPSGGGATGTTDPSTSYAWSEGTFSGCSLPCGGGVQTREVTCVASDGSIAPDSACAATKPEVTQACNAQSCSNTGCTPAYHFGGASQFLATSSASGAGPLTVSFDMTDFSYFPWDEVDFGDGTTFPGSDLTFVNTSAGDGDGNHESTNTCVVHTFTAPGTYSVGRALTGNTPNAELTVTVQ